MDLSSLIHPLTSEAGIFPVIIVSYCSSMVPLLLSTSFNAISIMAYSPDKLNSIMGSSKTAEELISFLSSYVVVLFKMLLENVDLV